MKEKFFNAFADAIHILDDVIVHIYYENKHIANGLLISKSSLVTVFRPVFEDGDSRVFQVKYGRKCRPDKLKTVSTAGNFKPHKEIDNDDLYRNNIGFLKVSSFIEHVRVQTLIS